ncbi:MAG: efflux RND transporter periplasmic adaptor subunit [Verrucomicrobia bacterium]|nr:efflux RND transporter periplasmic adaptor subunit [Verrucomicrobiota bacterium]
MKKLIFIVIFLTVAGGMTWLVWFRPVKEPGEEKKPEADVPVHVAKITRATLRSYVTAYGPVEPEPKASARVAPALPGVVAAVKCVEGQRVDKGAILFQLDSRAADVAVSFAEKSVERQQRLAKVEGTSQKLLQEAELALAAARAQQALLQIQAPLTGVVTKVNVKAGEAADLTTVLAEVVDLDRLVVSVNVSSAELAALKVGQSAEVTSADTSNAVPTTVSFASLHVDAKTGSGLARAALPANCGLRPGQFVKVRVISEEHKDCLAVPVASVAKDTAGGAFVALVEDGKAVLKPVKIGLRDGDLVEVEGEGVEADKTVVTEGAYGIIMTQQFATKIRVVND